MDETSVIRTVGRYQLVSELGRGAMGVVSKGFDPKIGRTVALKTIAFTEVDEEALEFRRRLYGEASAAGVLTHPNIVTIYDVVEEGGMTAIAMEFIEGQTLAVVIRKQGPLPVDNALTLFEPICAALDYAGSRGIVHRDIKPANIIVGQDGSPKIADFGIARMSMSTATKSGVVLGSPGYMSPEQVRGLELDRRSDLFSAAAMFYEMITTDRPFEGDDTASLMYRIVHERHRPAHLLNPAIAPALAAVLDRALAKNPDDRFGTGAELIAALREAIAASSAEANGASTAPTLLIRDVAVPPAPVTDTGREARRRAPRVAIAAGVLAVAGLAAAGVLLMRGPAQVAAEPTPPAAAAAPARATAPVPAPAAPVSAPTASVAAAPANPAPPALKETAPEPVAAPAKNPVAAVPNAAATVAPKPPAAVVKAPLALPPPARRGGGLEVQYSGQAYPVVLYAGDRQLGRVEGSGLLSLDPGEVRIRAVGESVFLNQELGSVSVRPGERKPLLMPGLASAVLSVRGDSYAGLRIEVDGRLIAGPYPAQIPRIAEGAHVVRFSWIAGPMAGKELKQSFDAHAGGHFLIRAVPENAEITIQRAR